MVGRTFKVPQLSALLAHVLGRILREKMQLCIIDHEDWTFRHAADFTVAGKCNLPGYRFKHSRYVGRGEALMREELEGGKAEEYVISIRVLADLVHWDSLSPAKGEVWAFHVWIKTPRRKIHPASFGYSNKDSLLYPLSDSDEKLPRCIALWHERPLEEESGK